MPDVASNATRLALRDRAYRPAYFVLVLSWLVCRLALFPAVLASPAVAAAVPEMLGPFYLLLVMHACWFCGIVRKGWRKRDLLLGTT